MCVRIYVCLKTHKSWAEQKNAISWIICMTPQLYEILKKLCILPVSAFLWEKGQGSYSFTVPVH